MPDRPADALMSFIKDHPSPYHVVRGFSEILGKAGFTRLSEDSDFAVGRGGSYYVTRGGSSLIAFRVPVEGEDAFSLVSAHTDSPSWRVKANPVLPSKDGYVNLNVEGYGGMLMSPWFDRPLTIAGRVFYRRDAQVAVKLVAFPDSYCMMPSLAIHMDRNANHGIDYKVQNDLMPLVSQGTSFDFASEIAKYAQVEKEDILDYDLYLCNSESGKVWGAEGQFFSSPRIDDLCCAWSAVSALVSETHPKTIAVSALFDNEEVGSGTRLGALSDFLRLTLSRLTHALGWDAEKAAQAQSRSFMLSADNGHAVHPVHGDKCDPTNRPKMGGGVLIKFAANQKYTSDASTASLVENCLDSAHIPWQRFFNNDDIPGGSTLGNLSERQWSVPTCDIGIAQLAMHSPYETAAVEDVQHLKDAMTAFFGRGIWTVVD